MPPPNIKLALLKALEKLSQQNFDLFCHELVNRAEEPRVSRCRVEGRQRWEIVDVMVSTFTEVGVVDVAVETLKEIQCNEEADALARETRGGQ
ncbi:apoptosis-associated speck-like protein containing a CARD [Leuresthes tenuis]|uniref:apoptosis-associated speck-like protein containing a CARD n=1 Tax=Leuresthes tenuis TaxID=355514 RepID=UPI003B4FFE04